MDDRTALDICGTLAERLGLGSFEPRVIGRFVNVVVALEPLPVVARIATGSAMVRDAEEFARREVAIARFVAERGGHAVAPCEAEMAGPHHVDGWTVTLWRRIEIDAEAPDARESGRRLRRIHELLRDYAGPLSRWGAFDEIGKLLADRRVDQMSAAEDRAWVAARARRCRAELEQFRWCEQALHGDAHRKNVFATQMGPLWGDWEDAFGGPVEWDLACLVTNARVTGQEAEWADAALAGYGGYDERALELCVEARALFGLAWLWFLSYGDDARRVRAAAWLQWLRAKFPGR